MSDDRVAPAYSGYLTTVQELIGRAMDEHTEAAVATVARIAADRISDGRVLYVFGASHAGLLVQALFYRAGGLVPVQPILPRALMLDHKPVTDTSVIERSPGIASTFLEDSTLGDGDLLLVVSVSGRNAVPVEMCLQAQRRGATVVALTALAYSASVTGREVPRLFEVADHVIDLPASVGDAIISLGDDLPRVGPVSSAVGSAMLHGLMVEIASELLRRGIRPPVFASANLDSSAEWNAAQIAAWQDRLDYL